jgi:hypothetical protein
MPFTAIFQGACLAAASRAALKHRMPMLVKLQGSLIYIVLPGTPCMPLNCHFAFCRQTRKLQEMVKALQQENEDLKRRFACGGGGRSAGSGGGMHTANGVQLSTSGRQPSPFGSGPMQMVSMAACGSNTNCSEVGLVTSTAVPRMQQLHVLHCSCIGRTHLAVAAHHCCAWVPILKCLSVMCCMPADHHHPAAQVRDRA